ncbi:MAG: hypothetical protein U5K81_00045 [Trueperaceae bacterium]|nr:hypothetical protein [Trueperaceae bacterium]
MHERAGTIEASFSSKRVASLNPDEPVTDAFVRSDASPMNGHRL